MGADVANKVCLVDGVPLPFPYDYLVLATGVQHSYFGHDEYAAYAPGLKTLTDAVQLRNKILGAFEACERTLAPQDHPELLTFVIVGGGPTGVELAGAIAKLARQTLAKEFRRLDPTSLKLILAEAGPRILPAFAESLAAAATAKLAKLGVEVRTGDAVEKVDAEEAFGVRTAGLFAKLVWAFVHIQFLVLTSSRIGTLFRWSWKLFTRQRLARLIIEPEPMQDAIQATQHNGQRTNGNAERPRANVSEQGTVQ